MPSTKREKPAAELLGHNLPPQTTREKIIHVAMDLFYDHGFHAVGLDRIIAETGLTKTTFYNHFASRDDLILEVIRRRDALEQEKWLGEMERRAGRSNAREMLLAYFDVMHDWFNEPDFRGCMFINAAHEFPLPTDPVHQAAAAHKQTTLAKFRELAEQAGAKDPEALAQQIMVLGEGAITLRVAVGANDAALVARTAAQMLIERQLRQPSRSRTGKASSPSGRRK